MTLPMFSAMFCLLSLNFSLIQFLVQLQTIPCAPDPNFAATISSVLSCGSIALRNDSRQLSRAQFLFYCHKHIGLQLPGKSVTSRCVQAACCASLSASLAVLSANLCHDAQESEFAKRRHLLQVVDCCQCQLRRSRQSGRNPKCIQSNPRNHQRQNDYQPNPRTLREVSAPDLVRKGHGLHLESPTSCRSRNNLDDLLGDGGLAHAVHVQRERVDHVGGVVGCRIHRRHAGRVFGGDRLGHGVEEHGKNVLRQQAGEKLLGGLLVDVVDVRRCRTFWLPRRPRWCRRPRCSMPAERAASAARSFSSAVGSTAPAICGCPSSMSGSRRSTTSRCAITDLNSL